MARLLVLLSLVIFCLGFRVFENHPPWRGIALQPNAKTKIFVVFDHGTDNLDNNVDSGDPLYGTNPLTVTAAMNSIFQDFNSVQGAYVQLVDSSDTDFANESKDRIVYIRKQATHGGNSGETTWQRDSGKVFECDISLGSSAFKNAKSYLSTTTHELGHCMGLDHAQDTVFAIMSYFHDSNTDYRLQMDDKMGLIFLYPTDPAKAKETATLGLSCSRR